MNEILSQSQPGKNGLLIYDVDAANYRTINNHDFIGGGTYKESAFHENLVVSPTPKFHLSFVYNINTGIATIVTSGNGTATQDSSLAILSTTANTGSSAEIKSKNFLHLRPGQGGVVRFSAIFTSGALGSRQIAGLGNDNNGLFFGYSGNEFGIVRFQNGTGNWILQSGWNKDTLLGTGRSLVNLNKHFGNIYQIQYQWFEFGIAHFFVHHPSYDNFIEVHRENYLNNYNIPALSNSTLPFFVQSKNTTNNTNIVTKIGSAAGFLEGVDTERDFVASKFNTKLSITNTKTNILTIRNNTGFAGKVNNTEVFIDFISFACEGNKPVELHIHKNETITGEFVDISTTQSLVSWNTGMESIINDGWEIATFALGKSDSKCKEFDNLLLNPGESLTTSASSLSASDVSCGITWREKF